MRKTLLMTTMLVSSLAVAGSAIAAETNKEINAGTSTKTQMNTGAQGDGDGMKKNEALQTDGTATGSVGAKTKMEMTTGAQGDGDGMMKSKAGADTPFKSYSHAKDFQGTIAGGYSAEELMGTDVIGPDGNTIGEIDDLLVDADNKVSRVLVDVGGFLGIGEKKVAMDLSELTRTDGELRTTETEAQLESRVSYVEKDNNWQPSVSRNIDGK